MKTQFANLEDAKRHRTGQKVVVHTHPHRYVAGTPGGGTGNTWYAGDHIVYRNADTEIRERAVVVVSYGAEMKTTVWPLSSIRYFEILVDEENPLE